MTGSLQPSRFLSAAPVLSFLVTAALAVASCGPPPVGTDGGTPPADAPGASGAICPSGGTPLRWATFGEGFFATYCTRCHASSLVGATARSGAPAELNWDVHATVTAHAARIDRAAAAGPGGVNAFMPPTAPTPTEAERRQLGEWLACGAP